jgi:intracellular sulfur oxidation DsrE/DsrF family protein
MSPDAPSPAAADDPWIARLKGKNRVVFHSHLASDGIALRWAQTYLDTQKSVYGLTDADSSVVVGLNGRAIGLLFNDAIWGRYPIGETLQMPGSRNANVALVAQLVSRGVMILACNNSLRAAGQRFLPEAQRGDAARRTAFSDEAGANLLPGVEVVPAMIVTLQQAQDRGCRYVYGGG